MCRAARTRSSATCSGVSTAGTNGLTTPTKQTCGTPFASSLLCSPTSRYTRSLSCSLATCMRKYPAFIRNIDGSSSP